MHQIRLRYGIDAPIDEVRHAFATLEGGESVVYPNDPKISASDR